MPTCFTLNNPHLLVIHRTASQSYWENRWRTPDLCHTIQQNSHDVFITDTTKKYLPAKSEVRILEGGCGQGSVVLNLKRSGYDTYGIDSAKVTVEKVKQCLPDLPIQTGDVRQLPYPDNSFDGYWSLGVIEHDLSGYSNILRECSRVLKKNGYLFITFPHLSTLRRIKKALHVYPLCSSEHPANFYQFFLDSSVVIHDLKKHGFIIRKTRPHDALKGLKEELPPLNPIIKKINKSNSFPARVISAIIEHTCYKLCGHIILIVAQKNA